MVFWFLLESAMGEGGLPWHATSLSGRERERYERLRFPRRQREWLLGRYAAKVLLSRAERDLEGRSLAEIEILNEESGAPFVVVDGRRREGTLSISHRAGLAFVAWDPRGGLLGVDVERIEPRFPGFEEDFFTDRERTALSAFLDDRHALGVTLVWSLKEAVLKALRQGLRLDTRQVEVHLPSAFPAGQDWQNCEMVLSTNSLPWLGSWRRWGDYVLTVTTGIERSRLKLAGWMLEWSHSHGQLL